jgi:uncharacterized membrane protein YcfT
MPPPPAAASPPARHDWMDTAKGICIVAVVTMYTTSHVSLALGTASWMAYWVEFARPFRMPDFFFISGLLLGRVIDRPWRRFADRKVVHYLYFFVLWSLLYFGARAALGQAGENAASPGGELVKVMTWGPFAMLWFIQMLPLYMVLTRLLRRVPWPLVLAAAALWHLAPIDTPWTQVDRAGERFVFFYGGHVLARGAFAFTAWVARHRGAGLAAALAWALGNGALVFGGLADVPGIGLLLGFLGAFGVMAVAVLLQPWRAGAWLRACGERSLPIFLGFYVPMSILMNLWLWLAPGVPLDAGLLALLLAAASIVLALAASHVLRRTRLRWLYERPAWARLEPEAPRSPAATELARRGA